MLGSPRGIVRASRCVQINYCETVLQRLRSRQTAAAHRDSHVNYGQRCDSHRRVVGGRGTARGASDALARTKRIVKRADGDLEAAHTHTRTFAWYMRNLRSQSHPFGRHMRDLKGSPSPQSVPLHQETYGIHVITNKTELMPFECSPPPPFAATVQKLGQSVYAPRVPVRFMLGDLLAVIKSHIGQ